MSPISLTFCIIGLPYIKWTVPQMHDAQLFLTRCLACHRRRWYQMWLPSLRRPTALDRLATGHPVVCSKAATAGSFLQLQSLVWCWVCSSDRSPLLSVAQYVSLWSDVAAAGSAVPSMDRCATTQAMPLCHLPHRCWILGHQLAPVQGPCWFCG
jgi:hypothetical protein